MKPDPGKSICRIRPSVANPFLRKTLQITRGMIEHSLKLNEIDRIYRDASAVQEDLPFADKVFRAMNVGYEISPEDRALIPAKGPVVVVANHPFGGIEGIVLLSLLGAIRPDAKVMANLLLERIPEMRDGFIFVDPFGGKRSARANIGPLKQSLLWLKDGGLLATFPAGEVSSVDLRSGKVRDPAWSPTVARLIRHSRATVVPVYFTGHNGALFQLAGLVHPRMRTLMLPSQVVNKRNRVIRVCVGQPIPWKDLEQFAEDEKLIGYLRLRTYVLAGREEPKARGAARRRQRRAAKKISRQQPVAAAEDPEALLREVSALDPEQLLLTGGDLDVYLARAAQIPAMMREMGRLREVTFRAVGEGTGQPRDLDVYDEYYLHLFIWNRVKTELVGAYRLGLADAICEQYGVKGLYTRSLFRFDRKLIDSLQPAIELGRSFVRPEYQKAYASLFLLWKGIAAFLARNPRYRALFGPVSITNEYRDVSRNLLLRSLRLSNFAPELARFVKPLRKPRRARRAEWNRKDFSHYLDDLDEVSAMIQDIEQDRKGVPILVKQYLRMGGRVLAFSVDPSFGSVIDALVAMDLTRTDEKTLNRYMGKENAAVFMAQHGMLSADASNSSPEPAAAADA